MIIEKIDPSDFQKAQDFYSSVGYTPKIQQSDIVLCAFEESKIIGVVRIAHEHEVLVLRGMMIAEEHQRQGLGTKMIKKLEHSIGKNDCFCIPHDWLEGFYGQIGFIKTEDCLGPKHLQTRLIEVRKEHPHLILMKRSF